MLVIDNHCLKKRRNKMAYVYDNKTYRNLQQQVIENMENITELQDLKLVGMSVNEVQALVSIIVTVLGFVISVIIPMIMKLIGKIKEAKKDGKIDEEEMKDIVSTGKEILDETKKEIEEIKDKHAGDR